MPSGSTSTPTAGPPPLIEDRHATPAWGGLAAPVPSVPKVFTPGDDCNRMERVRAALGGLAVFVVVLGGFVAVRTVSRLLWAAVWVLETAALAGVAALLGYVAYRVLWGDSDDPRRH